jgi:hypothetical protein
MGEVLVVEPSHQVAFPENSFSSDPKRDFGAQLFILLFWALQESFAHSERHLVEIRGVGSVY